MQTVMTPRRLTLLAAVVFAASFAHAQIATPFEQVGAWSPNNADTLFDMGGWNGTAIVGANIPGTDNKRTYTISLSDPTEPFIIAMDTNFGIGVGSGDSCSFSWDAPIEVRDGFARLSQSEGCTFDSGGQPGFSLESVCEISSLPGAPYYLDVTETEFDFGMVHGTFGDDFTAAGADELILEGYAGRAGESGTLDVGFNFERLLTDGNRLYASRAQTRAFDLTSLENPVQLYHWNEALLLVEGGVGFTLGFNASDPSLREIRTWDMTPSKGPALLGSTVFEGVPNRVYAYEGLVYIATTTGVNIIDASDAATPEVIASDHSIGDVRTMGATTKGRRLCV